MHRQKKIIHILGASGLCLGLLSCKPAKIKQYSVDKEKITVQPVSDLPTNKDFTYTLPDGWQEKAASNMRQAAFSVAKDQAEVSVVSLPGSAGDLKGNVNRWRGQVGLPPVESEAEIIKTLTATRIDNADAFLLDLQAPEGQKDSAMHVAFAKHQGQSWFFKLSGPLDAVTTETPAFEQFIQSVKFTAPNGTSSASDAATDSGGAPSSSGSNAMNTPMNNQMLADTAQIANKMTYETPADWQKQETSGMRSASFKVQKNGETADVSVIGLTGDGGGVLNNVNRWREQAGLGPIQQNELDKMFTVVPIDGHSGYYLSILTDTAESNMLITLVETPESTWFIKMSGAHNLLQTQEQNFLGFVKSIHFNPEKEPQNG